MSTLKKIGSIFLDILEIYIPSLTFIMMFVAFILQIFFRYVLRNPLIWAFELTLIGFIWTTMLGACYTRRHNSHVSFSLLYDRVTPEKKRIFRLIGNAFIASAFIIAIYPSYDYIMFMGYRRTPVLRIPFHIIYFPYIIFLILVTGRSLYDIVKDIKELLIERRGAYGTQSSPHHSS